MMPDDLFSADIWLRMPMIGCLPAVSMGCNSRAARCERLLSEAYDLAAEGEGLLKDRDARLNALQ